MTGTDCLQFTHKKSRSYLNHLVHDCTITSCSNADKKKEVSADSLWLSEHSSVLRGMISGMLCTISVYSSSQLDSVSNGRNSALYLPTQVIMGY